MDSGASSDLGLGISDLDSRVWVQGFTLSQLGHSQTRFLVRGRTTLPAELNLTGFRVQAFGLEIQKK